MLRLPVHDWTGSARIQSVIVAGRRLHYVTRGTDGPPVVLLHGLSGSWRWWCRNIDPLAEQFRVYALDLSRRDHWLGDRRRLRLSEAGHLLAGWLTAVGLERADLIGHSLGGLMAVQVAAAYPTRVGRLVLVNAAGVPPTTNLLGMTARALGPVPERTSEFRRLVMADFLRANPLMVLTTAREMLRYDVTGLLARVTAPTLIVWGARDHVLPVTNAAIFQAGIAGARLYAMPHAGHNPMYYHADEFNRVVTDFLTSP